MSILSGAWETFKTFLTLSDNLKRLNAESRAQQQRIEALTERVVRLEVRAELTSQQKRDDSADPPV
jgi:hypothetical protein